MKYLKMFRIYESDSVVRISNSNGVIDNIDPEIIDNCKDIVRDFNEDNNCNIAIQIKYHKSYLGKETILKNKKSLISIVPLSISEPSLLDPYIKKYNKALLNNNMDIKDELMRHIVSYFQSKNYKYFSQNIGGPNGVYPSEKYYFYLDNIKIKSKSPIKRIYQYLKRFNEKIVDYDTENIKLF